MLTPAEAATWMRAGFTRPQDVTQWTRRGWSGDEFAATFPGGFAANGIYPDRPVAKAS